MAKELYLGGFYSSVQLALEKFRVGAGIYVTNRTLFLFREDMDAQFKKMITGSGRKDFLPANLTEEQNEAILKELSSRSPPQIGLRKEEISSMEMKQPPGLFRTGHLKVSLISGDSVQLIIGKKKEYEYIQSLLQSFNPQALKYQ